jgi:hypothetical protein
VDETRRVQHHVARLRLEQVGEDVRDDRRVAALRVPNELQPAARPARREQEQRVVRLRIDARVRVRSAAGQLDQIRERQQLAAEIDVAIDDRKLSAGNADDLLLLGRGQPRVERHARNPRLRASEIERDRIRAVTDEQSYAVAPAPEQDVGDAARQLVHLAEREHVVAAEDSRTVAMASCAPADQLGRPHPATSLSRPYPCPRRSMPSERSRRARS